MSALLASSPSAWALTQPGSTEPIPVISETVDTCSDNNVQACLDDEEGAPTIDAQEDGDVTPETFDPRCNLTFNILNRGAGFADVFGWYNVRRDADGDSIKPEVSELYTFILGSEEPPFERTLDLRDDPNYAGGEIGFFIATGEEPRAAIGGPPSEYDNIFYSERQHNPEEPGSGEPSIHLVIWQSVTYADSFYFGWEDLLDPSANDNDFDDIFTRVSGIQCAGGGAECDTGEPGVCKEGTMQCQQGELTCIPNTEPSDEICNALDDDCDGKTDEGEEICPEDNICDRGKCVPRCGTGEFRCLDIFVCSDKGACVDPACEDVECPEGKICTAGKCTGGCEGVTCPYGEVCRLGRCMDPCDTITCDEGYSCELGVCVDCDCVGCSSGQSCVENVCIDDACENVSCKSGTHCVDGDCVDDCEAALCPGGADCRDGACQAPDGMAGAAGSANGGSGGIVIGTGGSTTGGTTGTGGDSVAAGTGGEDRTPRDVEGGGDCSCRSNRRTNGMFASVLAAALAGIFVTRRRRRRSCY
ncbi:MAG TPA: DUF4114 domain-containing protein [Polyangiaceae bacterium]|nr:DUF4114 domain-containing protein [Polyangiaceae bacterium]